MKNKENFQKELAEIALHRDSVALINGKPVSCMNTQCEKCDFCNYHCEDNLAEWAESEYKEPLLDDKEDADQFISDEDEAFRNTLPKVKDGLDKVVNLGTHLKIEKLINDCPTVDAVSVVHAHWDCIENVISYEGTFDAYECSHCHKSFLDDLCENNGSDYVDAKNDFEYCPFCGAKMDEEVEEKK